MPITARSERECTKAAEFIKAEYRVGKRVEKAAGLTLRQAAEQYIDKRRNVLSPSTIRCYTIIKNNRFMDVMDKPIKSIKDWQAICNDEAALCSAKTLRNAWLLIASVLREQGETAPKITLPQIVREEKAFLDAGQIPIFIAAVMGTEYEVPALLALHGLRRSEIWAMPDIDLKAGIIKVRGAVVPDESNTLVSKKTNKNATSRRDVPIMIPELTTAVETRRAGGQPLFSISPELAKYHIDKICREVGLPEVGLHGLRHSFASLAYSLNVPEMYVMQIGGWSDYGTMRKIYTHFAQKDALKSQKTMTEFFKNANENATK